MDRAAAATMMKKPTARTVSSLATCGYVAGFDANMWSGSSRSREKEGERVQAER